MVKRYEGMYFYLKCIVTNRYLLAGTGINYKLGWVLTNNTMTQHTPTVEEVVNKTFKDEDTYFLTNQKGVSGESVMLTKTRLDRLLTTQREAGAREERERIEAQFPDYAHTRYLGCYEEGGRWHYSYDTEVVYLLADFLTSPHEEPVNNSKSN